MKAVDTTISHVLIALLKGVMERSRDEGLWQVLAEHQSHVRTYLAEIGLEVIVDDAEGYAYLRQRVPDEDEDAPELPRLVARRQLSYPVSLILALLRKRVAEVDAKSGDTRIVVTRNDLVDMVRIFLPDSSNEARFVDRIETYINKIIDLGFLRRLSGSTDHFEVQRILKAYIDAQWLGELEQRLAQYRAYGIEKAGGNA
jgi:hypothetical protein